MGFEDEVEQSLRGRPADGRFKQTYDLTSRLSHLKTMFLSAVASRGAPEGDNLVKMWAFNTRVFPSLRKPMITVVRHTNVAKVMKPHTHRHRNALPEHDRFTVP